MAGPLSEKAQEIIFVSSNSTAVEICGTGTIRTLACSRGGCGTRPPSAWELQWVSSGKLHPPQDLQGTGLTWRDMHSFCRTLVACMLRKSGFQLQTGGRVNRAPQTAETGGGVWEKGSIDRTIHYELWCQRRRTFFLRIENGQIFFTKCMANDDFSESPRHAEYHFHFLSKF